MDSLFGLTELSAQELQMLMTHSLIISFKAGEIVLSQGKKTEGIYLILNGLINIRARIMGQGTTNIETLERGSFFGGLSFIENGPSMMSFIAKDEVQCLMITRTYFDLLSTCFPEIKYKLLKAISKQISDRLKRMHDKTVEFITSTDMTSLSFLGRVAHSLTLPKQISWAESGIELSQLHNKALFDNFSKDEINDLFSHALLLKAPKNCKLIYAGEKEAACYIVIQGAVQSSIMKDNKLAKLSVIGPATLFSSIACIDQESDFTITFITCEQAVLYKLSESDLNYFKQNKPELWYKLFTLICGSIVALGKSIDKLDIRLNVEIYNR